MIQATPFSNESRLCQVDRANEDTGCERVFRICPSLETKFSETIGCLRVRVGRTRKTEANTVNKTTQRD